MSLIVCVYKQSCKSSLKYAGALLPHTAVQLNPGNLLRRQTVHPGGSDLGRGVDF